MFRYNATAMRFLLPLAAVVFFPAAAQVLTEPFTSTQLDRGRWDLYHQEGATSSTGAGLQASLNGAVSFSKVRAITYYSFSGDFDVQVSFNLGAGWNTAFPGSDASPQLNGGGLTVFLDEPNWMTLFRSRFGTGEGFSFYSNVELGGSPRSQFIPSASTQGTLRIVSSGGTYRFSFSTGAGFTEIATAPAWGKPVHIALETANIGAHVSFSTTFTNFRVNSGTIDYRPYSLPANSTNRAGFRAGGQFLNSVIHRWLGGFSNYTPMNQLAGQGMSLARGCVTNLSSPLLANTPVEQWKNLTWQDSFWSSREMITQLFKDAQAAGMRINACYMFSDTAAHASVQNAPVAWQGQSLTATEALVEQFSFDITSHFKTQGIAVDLYSPGSEILNGILNFRPGDRIPAPSGVNFAESPSYMANSVWPTQAVLLKAAIRGIKRADPAARIALHVESSRSPGMDVTYAFFETMKTLGVPYDVAALSLPYADYDDLSGFTSASYFQRWETLVNRISALGKTVFIAEANHPSANVPGSLQPPSPDFPFTNAGQATFLNSQMRWASNNPNIIGWTWFYPEWFPGITGGGTTPVLQVAGLFSDSVTPRPSLAALNPFIQPAACAFTVTGPPAALASTAGSTTAGISTPFWCGWTATGGASWLTIVNASGMGAGAVSFTVAANPAGASRSANVTIAGQTISITQAGAAQASVTLTPASATSSGVGGSGTIAVTSNGSWTAISNANWIQITQGASGSGNGSISFTVAANPTASVRSGTVSVNAAVFTVDQAGQAPVVTNVSGSYYVPITPCRAADTRSTAAPVIQGQSTRSFNFTACGIPSNATGFALNVTVVPQGPLGYLTIWPAGGGQPTASTLNSLDGRVKANAVIVGAGNGGAVSVFVTETAHVILDINGYFVPVNVPDSLAFYPVTPCRVLDTRGPGGGGALGQGEARQIPGGGGCLPAQAQAYSLNVTVVPTAGTLGYLTMWPAGPAQPGVSTLNAPTGTVVANAAIMRAGTGGALNVFVTNPSHLIVDLNGYFAPPGGAGALVYYPIQPCRINDTRSLTSLFGGPRMEADTTRDYAGTGSGCGVPNSARAYILNATVVPPGPFGYLTLWPGGLARPVVSTLNSVDGALASNAAIVPVGSDGNIRTYTSDPAHLLLDISGYFAPVP
jgi:hypothetical protein